MTWLSDAINAYPRQVAYAAREDEKPCPCGGSGWILNPYDFFQKCPVHYNGQPDPEQAAWDAYVESKLEEEGEL